MHILTLVWATKLLYIFWCRHHLAVVADLNPTHVLASKMLIQLSLICAGSSHWAKTRATHMAETKERRQWELLLLQLCKNTSWAVSDMTNSPEITGRTHRNGRNRAAMVEAVNTSPYPRCFQSALLRLPGCLLWYLHHAGRGGRSILTIRWWTGFLISMGVRDFVN